MTHAGELEGGADQSGPLKAYKGALRALDRVSYILIVAVMAAMSSLVSIQVFYRYALSSSIDSADELSRLFFVWAIFLAIPHGVKYGVHVGIDLIVRLMPARLQEAMFRLSAALGALLMVVTLVVSLTATIDKWPELMPTMPVTAALFYIPVLISAGHSLLHLIALVWGGSTTWAGENEL
jgi:TRAP-type C4-dicarboxylate transport system permease small subunit